MGDFHKEEFSEEELKALGEAEEKTEAASEEKGPETQEATEKPAEEVKPEEKGDAKAEETEQKAAEEKTDTAAVEEQEEKLDPVQKRINKLTFEKNEERRKRELAITLGPERFFELYPEDKPADWKPAPKAEPAQPPTQPAAPVQAVPSTAAMIARLGNATLTDGPYKGETLNAVLQTDPAYGYAVIETHRERVQAQQARQRDEQIRTEIDREVQTFNSNRAAEMFGKSVRECTAAEISKLKEAESAAIEYIEKSGNPSLPLEHAYWKTVHEAKRGKETAAKEKLDKVTGGNTVRSIGTGTVPGVDVEWQGYLSKTPDQMTRVIDRMPEKELSKFLKDAPKAVREKFKSLPWD